MSGRRKIVLGAALTPLAVVVLLVIGWAIDTGVSSGAVARNVELADRGIGGVAEERLPEIVDDLAAGYAQTAVTIETPDATYETTAAEIGLGVDTAATVESALDVGRTGFVGLRPFRWFGSLFAARDAAVRFRVDEAVTRETIVALEGDERTPAVEPYVTFFNGGAVPVPGEVGMGIDPAVLGRALMGAAARADSGPVAVSVLPGEIRPRVPDDEAAALADRANELMTEPITAIVGDATVDITPEQQLTWVGSTVAGDATLELVLGTEKIRDTISNALGEAGTSAVDASFTIENGQPVLVPGSRGQGCCADDSGRRILDALRSGSTTVELDLVDVEPELTTEEAEALGITGEIGRPDEFGPTTRHACCANRVRNIHRIADIVRGAIIEPGGTFSVNDYVGRRTREKGFVADGVIYNGVLTQDVGGGVSQFATTLFNAALYAGLDFGEYQSHSLYISRYPRGHEATISFPAPDLEIVNNTEYGVLIWPTYTDTSITVHLYSTPHIEVAVGDPSSSRSGRCTTWTTPRTRTYPDGTVDRDTVFARYRPGEGISC